MIIKKKLFTAGFQDHPLDDDSPCGGGIMANLLIVGKSVASIASSSAASVELLVDDNNGRVHEQPTQLPLAPLSQGDVVNPTPPSSLTWKSDSEKNNHQESSSSTDKFDSKFKSLSAEKSDKTGENSACKLDANAASRDNKPPLDLLSSKTTRDAETLVSPPLIVNHPNGDHPYCNLSRKTNTTASKTLAVKPPRRTGLGSGARRKNRKIKEESPITLVTPIAASIRSGDSSLEFTSMMLNTGADLNRTVVSISSDKQEQQLINGSENIMFAATGSAPDTMMMMNDQILSLSACSNSIEMAPTEALPSIFNSPLSRNQMRTVAPTQNLNYDTFFGEDHIDHYMLKNDFIDELIHEYIPYGRSDIDDFNHKDMRTTPTPYDNFEYSTDLKTTNELDDAMPFYSKRKASSLSPMMNGNGQELTLTQLNSPTLPNRANGLFSNHPRNHLEFSMASTDAWLPGCSDPLSLEDFEPTVNENSEEIEPMIPAPQTMDAPANPIPHLPIHSSPVPVGQQQQQSYNNVMINRQAFNSSGHHLVSCSNDQFVPAMVRDGIMMNSGTELPPATSSQSTKFYQSNVVGGRQYSTNMQMGNGQTSTMMVITRGRGIIDRERNHSMSTDLSSYDEGFASHDDDDNSDNSEPMLGTFVNNQQQPEEFLLGHNGQNQIQMPATQVLEQNFIPVVPEYHQMVTSNLMMVKEEPEILANNYGQDWPTNHQEENQQMFAIMEKPIQPMSNMQTITEQGEYESDEDEDDDDDESFYGNYDAQDLIGANLSGDDNNKWSWNMGRTRKSSEKRFFWQYNVQSKGPKGPRIGSGASLDSNDEDPHVINEIADPVFAPDCQVEGVKHNGKARRGDGNDLTPNPKKLVVIGLELKKLSKTINGLTPVTELPATSRNKSRKEKNKLASRACRLKKKAQHEANKIKLRGLQTEHRFKINLIKQLRHVIEISFRHCETGQSMQIDFDDNQQSMTLLTNIGRDLSGIVEQICRRNQLRLPIAEIAGKTPDFVNHILDNVTKGLIDGGLNDLG